MPATTAENITVDFGNGLVLAIMEDHPAEVVNFWDDTKRCLLCPEAIALHDFIKGAEVMSKIAPNPEIDQMFPYALAQFSKLWPEEYMILLD